MMRLTNNNNYALQIEGNAMLSSSMHVVVVIVVVVVVVLKNASWKFLDWLLLRSVLTVQNLSQRAWDFLLQQITHLSIGLSPEISTAAIEVKIYLRLQFTYYIVLYVWFDVPHHSTPPFPKWLTTETSASTFLTRIDSLLGVSKSFSLFRNLGLGQIKMLRIAS